MATAHLVPLQGGFRWSGEGPSMANGMPGDRPDRFFHGRRVDWDAHPPPLGSSRIFDAVPAAGAPSGHGDKERTSRHPDLAHFNSVLFGYPHQRDGGNGLLALASNSLARR